MDDNPKAMTRKRLLVLLCAFVLGFFVLVGKLGEVMVARADELKRIGENQWTRTLTVSAKRGMITDINGKVLAQSATAYTAVLRPQELRKKFTKDKKLDQQAHEAMITLIAETLEIDRENVAKKAADEKLQEFTLKRQIDPEKAKPIREAKLAGVYLLEDTKRYYPMGAFLAQVIGFCDVSGQGQSGLEKSLDSILKGESGEIVTQTDKNGREMPYDDEKYVEAQNGQHVVLTIDSLVQGVAEREAGEGLAATRGKAVQVIVMDVRTGAILAVVNKQDFDPNDPPRNDIALLNQLTRDGVVADAYEPGSTFKMFTVAAALDEQVVTENYTYNCTGSILVDGDKVNCWRTGNPHGHQSLTEVLMNSCNPSLVDIGLKVGKDKLYRYINGFGFGNLPGSGLPGESGGIVRAVKYVRDVDLARIAFGQSIAVTPLQLITAGCAVVNGGDLMKPYIVDSVIAQDGQVIQQNTPQVVGRSITPETSDIMRGMLEKVVSEGGGRNAYIPGYRVGGKTGTAQKYENGRIMKDTHVSSFIGFAPMDDPQVAVLYIVNEPGVRPDFGSVTAAPYAKVILEETLKHHNVKPVFKDAKEQASIGKTVKVPQFVGESLANAGLIASQNNLKTMLEGEGAKVVDQLPPAGSEVSEGSMVLLYMSGAPEPTDKVAVPDVAGKTLIEANRMMRSYGLVMKINGTGIAVSQEPPANKMVVPGTQVVVKFAQP